MPCLQDDLQLGVSVAQGPRGGGATSPRPRSPQDKGLGQVYQPPASAKEPPREVERAGNVADGGTSLVTTGEG